MVLSKTASVKSQLFPLIFFLALPLVLSSCGARGEPGRSENAVVVALESGPTQIDPRYAMDADSERIGALIFNTLVRADKNSRPRPELAESWSTPDDRTYLFHLRQGVVFHDGRPLEAADVKYTYESVLDPASRSPKRGALRFLAGIDRLGPYDVRFRLATPYAPFLDELMLGIVPRPAPGRPADERIAIGSGAFKLVEFSPGERVVLKANPAYWEGGPELSGVVFKIIPDAIVRVLEFKKGGVDLIQNYFEPDMLPWLEKNSRAVIARGQGNIFQYIGMNLEHPALARREVREAIGRAIDRDAVIRHVLKDLAVPATGLLAPDHWAYEPAVTRLAYDPARAKKLLDQAGFPDPDGDGPRPRFKLSYKTTNLDLRKRIAEAFKEQLARVGIELEVRTFEWGTFYGDVARGNFQLYSLEWVGTKDPDLYYDLFHSSSMPPNGRNRGRYRNAELDALLEHGRQTLVMEERKRIYSQVQKIAADDLPYIPLWWWKNVAVMKPEVSGYELYPDGKLISLKRASLQ